MEVYPEQSVLVDDGMGGLLLDRAIGDDFMVQYHKSLYSDGLLSNDASNYRVTSVGGLRIRIERGLAVGGGRFVYMSDYKEITLESSGAEDVTYLVGSRYVKTDRMFNVIARKGASYTDLIRTAEVYDLVFAVINVPMNATLIDVPNINDVRFDSRYCGVSAGILQVDTTDIFNQYQYALNSFLDFASQTRLEADNIIKSIITDINLVVLSVSDFDANDRFPGTRVTVDLTSNPYAERRTIISDNFLLAERSTFFHADNIYVTETTTFHPRTWTVDGRTVSSFASVRNVVTNLQTLESEVQ